MERFRRLFNGVEDQRTSNATRHDFHEMLMIAVFSSLRGGQACVDMADCAKNNEKFPRRFMRLERGLPSHDSFSRLFRMIKPARFASDWAKIVEAEGIRRIAIDDKVLRRTFSRAEEHRSFAAYDEGQSRLSAFVRGAARVAD